MKAVMIEKHGDLSERQVADLPEPHARAAKEKMEFGRQFGKIVLTMD